MTKKIFSLSSAPLVKFSWYFHHKKLLDWENKLLSTTFEFLNNAYLLNCFDYKSYQILLLPFCMTFELSRHSRPTNWWLRPSKKEIFFTFHLSSTGKAQTNPKEQWSFIGPFCLSAGSPHLYKQSFSIWSNGNI